MIGLGTIINVGAIVLGGILGGLFGKKVSVANLLPAIVIAVAWAFLPV